MNSGPAPSQVGLSQNPMITNQIIAAVKSKDALELKILMSRNDYVVISRSQQEEYGSVSPEFILAGQNDLEGCEFLANNQGNINLIVFGAAYYGHLSIIEKYLQSVVPACKAAASWAMSGGQAKLAEFILEFENKTIQQLQQQQQQQQQQQHLKQAFELQTKLARLLEPQPEPIMITIPAEEFLKLKEELVFTRRQCQKYLDDYNNLNLHFTEYVRMVSSSSTTSTPSSAEQDPTAKRVRFA